MPSRPWLGASWSVNPWVPVGEARDVVPHYTVSPSAGLEGALEGFSQGGRASLFLDYDANGNLAPALEVAKAADAVIIMAGTIAEEMPIGPPLKRTRAWACPWPWERALTRTRESPTGLAA